MIQFPNNFIKVSKFSYTYYLIFNDLIYENVKNTW